MSQRTSESRVFNDENADATAPGMKKVWNRRSQQWVEVPIEAAAAVEADSCGAAPAPAGSQNEGGASGV